MALLRDSGDRDARWAATHWSRIAALDGPPTDLRESSWGYLVSAYQRPMEEYVRRALSRWRGRPCSREDASALVQDFLGECAASSWLSRADPKRGPFRAFLQTLLRRFTLRHLRHERAARRTPPAGARLIPISDAMAGEPISAGRRADMDAFDRTWAQVAVERARQLLGKASPRYLTVIDDLILTHGEGSDDLAQRLGLRDQQLPVLRHRALKRFAVLFEKELAATVGDAQQFRDEWRALAPYLP